MGIITDKAAEKIGDVLDQLQHDQAAVAAGLSEFAATNRVVAARPLQLPSGTQSMRLSTGKGRIVGWSLTTTDGPVQLLLRDSWVAGNGDVLAALQLDQGKAVTHWLAHGVGFAEGLYLERLTGSTGTLLGTVYLGVVDS